MIRLLPDEAATRALGSALFGRLTGGTLVFLEGDLGAGKTTLVRGFLRAAGYPGAVKSPTFTLVEEYRLADYSVFHFDLYRLKSPDELEWMGFRDYLQSEAVCFIEWPERGEGQLPTPDLVVSLAVNGRGRTGNVVAATSKGRAVLDALGA